MVYTTNNITVGQRFLNAYNTAERKSTNTHIIQCSIYFRASIHVATRLRAVVNESPTGTGESV